MLRGKLSYVLLQFTAPSQGHVPRWTFPFISASLKQHSGCQKWLWHWGCLICLPSSLVLQGDQNNLTSGCTLLLCRLMSCLSSTVFICFINHLWANIADTCSAHPPCSPRESARSLVDCTLFQLVRLESNLAGVAWSLGCPVIPHSRPKSHQSQLPGKQTWYISIWSVRGLGFFFPGKGFRKQNRRARQGRGVSVLPATRFNECKCDLPVHLLD